MPITHARESRQLWVSCSRAGQQSWDGEAELLICNSHSGVPANCFGVSAFTSAGVAAWSKSEMRTAHTNNSPVMSVSRTKHDGPDGERYGY